MTSPALDFPSIGTDDSRPTDPGDDALAGTTRNDLLRWSAGSLVPQLEALLAVQVRRAVETETAPLRQRIRVLEAELRQVRAAVAKAVERDAA